jgi:leader peptidase (prepilin peptidase)/N-methyltransferase
LYLWLWPSIAFVYGLAIGSFLNVVIWRLPRGQSVAEPTWSYCPRCEHRLGGWDLVPVFSFLALRTRCRYCHDPISWRYPSIELLTGVLFALVAWHFAGTWDAALFYCLFTAILLCVFFIDLEHFVIPDGLNVLGVLIGFVHNGIAIALGRPDQWTRLGTVSLPASVVGFVGYAGIMYLLGLAAYVWFTGRRQGVGKAVIGYLRENILDWAWVIVYHLGLIIPPLRKHAEPPVPLESATAEEIEADEEAGGFGGGDGKLAAAIGANIGFFLSAQSLFFAIVLGATIGLVVIAVRGRSPGGKTAIPFGPAMAAGALLSLFIGHSLLLWYLGRIA